MSWQLFPAGKGFYNYAPCSIEEGQVHHFWWCQNAEPYVIRDHIYYRSFEFAGKRWTKPQLALAPGEPGQWDSLHVCDPSVVRGEFRYRGVGYSWLLFYLGNDLRSGKHNQVGVAVARAPAGPWQRISANPIVKGSAETWGSGEPSAINLDRRGHILLFFTRQEADLSTHTWLSDCDFSNLDHPVVGAPLELPTAGLTERPGAHGVVLNDADFALDRGADVYYVVRPQHPDIFAPRDRGLSSHLQIARIAGADLRAGKGTWTPVGIVGPEQTGFAHNHNACFGRDDYGSLPDPHVLRINLSVAERVAVPLWTYALQGYLLDLPR